MRFETQEWVVAVTTRSAAERAFCVSRRTVRAVGKQWGLRCPPTRKDVR